MNLPQSPAGGGSALPRVAVIGTGLIGRKHIALIEENAGLELVAVVNPSGGASQDVGGRTVPNFASHAQLLAAMPIDGAIVASPNETHADITVDLIRAGVPTLVEKPIAGDLAEGQRIVAAAERHGIPVLMGHHRRYNPLVTEMQQAVRSGELGPLVALSGVWSVYKPDPYYSAEWRTGPTGGPVMINLIHEIDYLHAIAGPIVQVGATAAPKRREHAGEEAIAAIFRFASGVIGTIVLSDSASSPWSWEQATGENAPTFPMNGQSPYRFLFERGAVEYPAMHSWRQEAPSWEHPFTRSDSQRLLTPMREVFARQIDHFREVIAGAAAPIVTARHGLEALNVALTVKRALASGAAFLDVPPLHVSDDNGLAQTLEKA